MSQSATVERRPDPVPSTDEPTEGTEDGSAGDGSQPLPLDVTFDLLSNDRRRRVIRYLLEETERTTLSDLAERLASIENDKPVRELSSAERKRVYICLYQCHLPKLDDADVIDFDEHRKTVEGDENLEDVGEYIAGAEDSTEPAGTGAKRYLAVVGVGGTLFGLQAVLWPNVVVSGVLVGAVLVSIAIAAAVHTDVGRAVDTTDLSPPAMLR